MNRNRYANVDPYLNNRIRLKVPEGYSDYINASPIVLRNTKSDTVTNFIATQVRPQSSLKGPLHLLPPKQMDKHTHLPNRAPKPK